MALRALLHVSILNCLVRLRSESLDRASFTYISLAWLFENYHRADRENPEMIQRFLSVSQLAVDKGFPLSAKLYLHFGELNRMDGVTRVPQQPGFEINEEDMLRINHLRDLVHFISLSLDEEKSSSKIASKKKDNSTLL